MGNFATDWTNRRFKVYYGYLATPEHQYFTPQGVPIMPTDDELKHLRALIFPGSARSVNDPANVFVEEISKFIRKVMAEYHEIKLFGSCFGHQIFGHAMGGKTEQMTDIDPKRMKIIGREYI
jgi:GMP synthase-like glutamine amidotransferase